MARPPKEYQAFTSLVDRLLKVPKDEVLRRVEKEKAASAANPRTRGPNRKRSDFRFRPTQLCVRAYAGLPTLSALIKERRQAVPQMQDAGTTQAQPDVVLQSMHF